MYIDTDLKYMSSSSEGSDEKKLTPINIRVIISENMHHTIIDYNSSLFFSSLYLFLTVTSVTPEAFAI